MSSVTSAVWGKTFETRPTRLPLLTTGSLDASPQVFSGDGFAHSVAYLALSVPVGERADWLAGLTVDPNTITVG